MIKFRHSVLLLNQRLNSQVLQHLAVEIIALDNLNLVSSRVEVHERDVTLLLQEALKFRLGQHGSIYVVNLNIVAQVVQSLVCCLHNQLQNFAIAYTLERHF